MHVGFAGVAAGNEGIAVYLKNVLDRRCVLDGYPALQMLAAGGRLIPTHTSTRPSYTIPPMKPRRVFLAHGQSATFFIGFADATGYGTRRCPASTLIAITPPGDKTSITVRMRLAAYGGSVQHLRCGVVDVSPLIAGLHRRI